MGIGRRIQQLRLHNGLTQEQLDEQLHVSRQSVSKWEMEQSIPEVEKIITMSEIFAVCTDDILLNEDARRKEKPQQLHFDSIYLIVKDFEKVIKNYYQDSNYKFILHFWVEDLRMKMK